MVTITLGTIGACIYCGASDQPLAKEHIVPLGLDGQWVLKKASCAACAEETSRFERDVLRRGGAYLRSALGLPTRNPEDRPTTFPVFLVRNAVEEEVQVPLDEYQYRFPFHIFREPTAISGMGRTGAQVMAIRTIVLGAKDGSRKSLEDLALERGVTEVRMRNEYQPVALARLIAKVAYGVAVARLGLGAFEEVTVLPAIRGLRDDIGTWVGNVEPIWDEQIPVRHKIELFVNDERQLFARVKLLADFGGPEYLAIIGTLNPEAADLVASGRERAAVDSR